MKASIVEMEGLLRGKCVPAKMLVNESLAEYLVRQFDALHEQVRALASENSKLRDWLISDTMCEVDETAFPATDAALREIRAQAVEDFTDSDLCGQEACGQACAYAAHIRAGGQP